MAGTSERTRIERSGELEIHKIPAGYDAGHDVSSISIGGESLAELVVSARMLALDKGYIGFGPCHLVLEIERADDGKRE